jgi:hypothetical protein
MYIWGTAMRLIEFASDAQAQLDLLRKIYDCTFSAITAQGKAKAAQVAVKKHRAVAKPKVKPNQFIKKPAAPIRPIAPMPTAPKPAARTQPVNQATPQTVSQAKPAPQLAKLPNSLKPLPTSVLNPINNKLPTPNDLAKNQSAP